MMNKLIATIGAALFMLSVGTTAAQAQHGADDAVPHARHGADDPAGHDANDDHGHRHGGHGADD
jgi:Spy/CpxP family protein refolding chaperone